MSVKARYIMIGGFLGAGKTTSVARLAERLTQSGLKVGLITNDQGDGLVDTATLASKGFATEEIAGGCFCCRFNSLLDAAKNLSAETRPDVFIAEPVGSCTDLVATVTYPLRRIYGDEFLIAPLSVLVDAMRALRVLELEEGGRFSSKVRYIYLKQLEEADLIVINKCDLINDSQRAALLEAMTERFPKAEVLEVSARNEQGLGPWFDRLINSEQQAREAMPIDYDVYAEGEALLGWLNATLRLESSEEFDGNQVLKDLANRMQRQLDKEGGEVAHLKMTLSPEGGFGELGVINLVRNDHVPELSQELEEPVDEAQVIINLRAELGPETLGGILTAVVEELNRSEGTVEAVVEHVEHFRPGRPVPVHRDGNTD